MSQNDKKENQNPPIKDPSSNPSNPSNPPNPNAKPGMKDEDYKTGSDKPTAKTDDHKPASDKPSTSTSSDSKR